MTSKIRLLAGASIGVAVLGGGFAPAFAAKPVHHAKRAATHRDAEVEALRAQVEALTARLDAQESNAAQNTAAIGNAQAQAAAANSAAQAAQAQAAAVQGQVPAEVKTALASQPKPKPQWFDSTSISGRMFFNFSNMTQKINGARVAGGTAGNGTGLDIKRMYISVDHTFSPIFSADVTMDASNVVGSTSNYNFNANSSTSPSNSTALVGRGFYIKKAYLQAKLDPALMFRIGSADMPWIPWIESQYGYRHIENTFIDRVGYGTSADWGVHALGDIAGGLISYQFSAIDGGTYRNVRITKTVDFEGRVSTSYKGFFAGVGGYSGKRANDVQGVDNTITSGLGHVRTATRLDAGIGYKNKLFTLGGEYMHAKNWNNALSTSVSSAVPAVTTVTNPAPDKSDGWAVFGNVNFAKQWSVFGRYDHFRPSEDINPRVKDDYFNAGIQWEPVKIVDLALVYKHEKINNLNGIKSYAYGYQNAPSLTVAAGSKATTSEIGLYGQFRF